MAYEIVKRLKRDNQSALLTQLADGLSARERRKGQQHKVFEESFDAKNIANEKFLIQKINYMHLNPVQGNITWFPIGGNMRIVVQGFMSCKELITLRRFTTRKAVT